MATIQVISTMATPLLVFNATAVFEAIDPADGSTVSGVVITNPVVSGVNLSQPDTGTGLAATVPQLTPIDFGDTTDDTGGDDTENP